MHELADRLWRQPGVLAWLLAAGLLINLLGLASSIYVAQVLKRFVSQGVNATLLGLTAGVVIALLAEHQLRKARLGLADAAVASADQRLAQGLFGLLLTLRPEALEKIPPGRPQELLAGLESTQHALGVQNVALLTDLPFSFLFLAALMPISPPLAAITALALALMLLHGWVERARTGRPQKDLRETGEELRALVARAADAVDAVRQFHAGTLLFARFEKIAGRAAHLRLRVQKLQGDSVAAAQMLQGLTTVAVIGVGALEVVAGRLDIGVLIGANIIAARALAPFARLAHLGAQLRAADGAVAAARALARLPVEPKGGQRPHGYSGHLELRGLGVHREGFPLPLFRGVHARLEPGAMLGVTGPNGAGKTTLARLLAGLIEPDEGQILADGYDLRQLELSWWRQQVGYLPQEPVFVDATVRQNLLAARPDLDEALLERCLRQAGVARVLAERPEGLELRLVQDGRELAPGIRRRLAFARALATGAPLMVLDEPTSGLDAEGRG